MNTLRYLKLAFNILVHSKLRSWLSVIGIVIGVSSVIAIMSLGEGMQQQMEENLGGLGADIITISPGAERAFGPGGGFREHGGEGRDSNEESSSKEPKNITDRDIQALKLIPNVAYIGGVVSGRGDMGYLSETASVSVQGADTKVWKHMITTELESGRYLSQGDKNAIVIGHGVADGLFKQDIQLNRQVTIEGTPFKVVGILKESKGFGGGGGDRGIYMPIEMARLVLDSVGDKELNSISIKVKDANLITETEEAITNKLMLVRAVTEKTKDFSINSIKATQETISSMLNSMTLFLGAIAGISLLVGAVGIANTMFTTVLQKTKEIGIMKAVGAKNKSILSIFLLNSGMIGLTGGLIGLGIGILLSKGVPVLLQAASIRLGGGGSTTITTVVTPTLALFVTSFSMLIGLISGVIPAYRASKMNPVDALRYE